MLPIGRIAWPGTMTITEILWMPAGQELDGFDRLRFVDITDGDTPNVRMPVRMLSTPLLNYPQTGILGMHNIVDRAVVSGGQVAVRPMMYLALTYDHRVVDGQGAVTFLVRVKENLEDPARLVLDL
jgi:pyruvate/2-oxoglutarate dehydrogenase complex dihydrolipoamide acyltransferase (E2) component